MKNPSKKRKTAAALVVTLSLLVVITVLILAFFVNSTLNRQLEDSSTDRSGTDLLARSALELIVADLKQEMLAGSMDVDATGGTLRPLSGSAMIPERTLVDTSMSNNPAFDILVKQSVAGRPMFTKTANSAAPKISGASSISTTTPARNNRRIGIQRWNAPLLVQSNFDTNQVPDWVYLGADGITNVTSSNVIGRFAFNVYNVGGLLNINVAGSPSALSAADKLALKGTPAGATLEGIIPGILDSDALVDWRNTQSGQTASGYVSSILAATNGFREPVNGDNRFVSRQDLIRYARQHPAVLTTNALPYLTTFSLERNTPSWGPMSNAPVGAYAYLNNSTNTASTNRLFTMTKNSAGGSIVTYELNGSARPAYTVQAGDPLIRQRFPLDRLKWITADGPSSAAIAPAIKSCFGLVWDTGNKQWNYDSAFLIGPSPGRIATLSEVAAAGREPNFFELLKASILAGSLGKTSNDGNSLTSSFDQNTDYQIIQIGCNIIDQFREDDFPTTIKIASSPSIYGIVDLPYLNKIYNLIYRQPQGTVTALGPQSADRWAVGAWLVPELWRPHLRSQFGPVAASRQIRVRIRDGSMQFIVQTGAGNFPQNVSMADAAVAVTSGPGDFRDVPRTVSGNATVSGPNAAYGEISDPGGFGILKGINVGFYNSTNYGVLKGGTTQAMLNGSIQPVGGQVNIAMEVESPAGNWVGYDLLKNYNGGATVYLGLVRAITGQNPASPDFRNTYQMPQEPSPPSHMILLVRGWYYMSAYWTGNALKHAVLLSAIARPDPRSDRFGLSAFLAAQPGWLRAEFKPLEGVRYFDPTTWPVTALDNAYRPELGGQKSVQRQAPNAGQFTGSGWVNNAVSSTLEDATGNYPAALTDNKPGALYYADNDGVQRRALGAYSSYFMNQADRTPIMLNRRFFTVGDLGYVHRGEPWKNLDFFTAQSADAGLLDVFTTSDLGLITEGKIDLNSAPAAVLQAYLTGTVMNEASTTGTFIGTGSVASVANDIRNEVKARPMINKSELVTRFDDASALRAALELDKARHETYIRGLADIAQTRTWNLMIDVIAQKGKIARNSTALEDFIVEGERRYWLHLAIDRFTGEILDRRLEAVYE